jgi:hypothetical protein
VIREMVQGDVLESVKIIRRREHDYDPDVFDADTTPMKLSEVLAATSSLQNSRERTPESR